MSILGICRIFLYFQQQIRALYLVFDVFIRFLISIKFSILINYKKKGEEKVEYCLTLIYILILSFKLIINIKIISLILPKNCQMV